MNTKDDINLIFKQILPTGTSWNVWISEMGIWMLILGLTVYMHVGVTYTLYFEGPFNFAMHLTH